MPLFLRQLPRLLALAALLCVAALPSRAWGQGGPRLVVSADIVVLHATNVDGPGHIDPAIGPMPQLRKPPLSAYNNYKMMDRALLPLEAGKSVDYRLPNGRVLQVTFVGRTPDHGFHVRTAIHQPGGGSYLKLLELTAKPNEPFFVAGQSFHGGSLVLAITLRP